MPIFHSFHILLKEFIATLSGFNGKSEYNFRAWMNEAIDPNEVDLCVCVCLYVFISFHSLIRRQCNHLTTNLSQLWKKNSVAVIVKRRHRHFKLWIFNWIFIQSRPFSAGDAGHTQSNERELPNSNIWANINWFYGELYVCAAAVQTK